MYIKKVKVQKGALIKEIEEIDAHNYVAVGWKIIKEDNPFGTTFNHDFQTSFNIKK